MAPQIRGIAEGPQSGAQGEEAEEGSSLSAPYGARQAQGTGWTKREADAVEWTRDWKAALRRRRRKLIAAQPKAGKLVQTAEKYIGSMN